ncbi:hypothetical protein T265_11694 [Opisthorchis viverrini]|uniref:Uncharacterized protein n=1 Tax=Opisthorchis viverrini TaxID=6198 RepID=A0A074Z247_OPIVI|nr:hypothetical protein T265_11694 [Opisthorchis viverrini]KER19572.1 hypothetical protein T265_11694 [Opisthorchis viverrini]
MNPFETTIYRTTEQPPASEIPVRETLKQLNVIQIHLPLLIGLRATEQRKLETRCKPIRDPQLGQLV